MAQNNLKTPPKQTRASAAKTPPGRPPESPHAGEAPPSYFSPLSVAGIRSGAFQSKVAKGFVLVAGFVMAASFAMTSLYNGGGSGGGSGPTVSPSSVVATVGNQSLTAGQLDRAYGMQVEQAAYMGQKVTPLTVLDTRQKALKDLTDRLAVIDAAEKAGVSPTNAEVDAKVESDIDDALKPQGGQTAASVRRMVESQYGSMEAARAKLRGQIDRDAVRKDLEYDDYKKQITAANHVTEADYKLSVTKLKLWDIVIRPALPTGKITDFPAAQAKATAAAAAKAAALVKTLSATPTLANFQAAVAKDSQDLTTKSKKGDFGWKLPSDITQAPGLGDALAKTATSVAGPFADPSGAQYIFFIESRKTDLPKDYATKKAQLIKDFKSSKDDELWQRKQDEIQKAATPDVTDPALAAYQLQINKLTGSPDDAQKQIRANIIDRYNEAMAGAPSTEAAAIDYQLSQVYGMSPDKADKAKAVAALADATTKLPEDPSIHLEYAKALRSVGNTKLALAQLQTASSDLTKSPTPPSPFGGGNPDDALREQIAEEFDANHQPALAKAERARIKPAAPGGMGGMTSIGGPGSPISIAPSR